MSAREICRLEGIQFFSDGCRVFDWLGFPLWHTPHSIEWRQQACKQCVHTDTGTDTHRDTWTHRTDKNTERQTAQEQHVRLKEDRMPGWKTGISAFSKASDLKASHPVCWWHRFIYLPKTFKALLCLQCRNDSKYWFIIKSKGGYDQFEPPQNNFGFGHKVKRLELKRSMALLFVSREKK